MCKDVIRLPNTGDLQEHCLLMTVPGLSFRIPEHLEVLQGKNDLQSSLPCLCLEMTHVLDVRSWRYPVIYQDLLYTGIKTCNTSWARKVVPWIKHAERVTKSSVSLNLEQLKLQLQKTSRINWVCKRFYTHMPVKCCITRQNSLITLVPACPPPPPKNVDEKNCKKLMD